MYEHDDDIYCKTCHTKNFKPKAVVPVTRCVTMRDEGPCESS